MVFSSILAVLSSFILLNQPQNALAAELSPGFSSSEISPVTISDAPNVSTLNDEIFFSGQPTASSILSFREKGVKTIINLRTEAEMQAVNFEESQLVESLGINYINIPIGRDELSDATIELLMSTLDDNSGEPLLMHCASSSRVGYVWALYQGTRGGASLADAIAQGKQAGMASPALEERATQYITRHLESIH